ncbi:hypothetical protein DAI22_05g112700 [Oryza sativa Japonica Group]|nr:hypothetical protein DAI22_05g112700 [Oryza sativa Japonica Group]
MAVAQLAKSRTKPPSGSSKRDSGVKWAISRSEASSWEERELAGDQTMAGGGGQRSMVAPRSPLPSLPDLVAKPKRARSRAEAAAKSPNPLVSSSSSATTWIQPPARRIRRQGRLPPRRRSRRSSSSAASTPPPHSALCPASRAPGLPDGDGFVFFPMAGTIAAAILRCLDAATVLWPTSCAGEDRR